jgi:hypothetical protein
VLGRSKEVAAVKGREALVKNTLIPARRLLAALIDGIHTVCRTYYLHFQLQNLAGFLS